MRDPAGAQRCAAGRAFVERSRRVSTAGNAVGCNRRGALPVLLQAQYDAWGNVTSYSVQGIEQGTDLSAWPLPHGFAGGLLDVDTGLLRFGARDYDPSVGRWTAKDPILFNGGQANLWVYVGNDPVNRQDPRGLWGFAVGGSAGAGFWGGVDVNVGIGFDYSNGNLTVFNYAGGVASLGAGDYGGFGLDFTAILGTVDQFAGSAVATRGEAMGLSFGADHGGSLTFGIGPGVGAYVGTGLSDTHVSGFQVQFGECETDVMPYERGGKWLP